MTLLLVAAGLVAGGVLWSFLEYVLHRFAFHERRGANYGSREHLRHHARRDYMFGGQWPAWLAVFGVGLGALNVGGHLLVGAAFGWALGIGFVIAYFTYEAIHAAAHLWAPRTRYGAWVRRHHFHHHFAEPLRNHGVTSSIWDHVFGTYSDSSEVVVPRRLAMVWLLDDDGDVRAEHRDVYRVRGARSVGEEDERVRAFANLAPLV